MRNAFLCYLVRYLVRKSLDWDLDLSPLTSPLPLRHMVCGVLQEGHKVRWFICPSNKEPRKRMGSQAGFHLSLLHAIHITRCV